MGAGRRAWRKGKEGGSSQGVFFFKVQAFYFDTKLHSCSEECMTYI